MKGNSTLKILLAALLLVLAVASWYALYTRGVSSPAPAAAPSPQKPVPAKRAKAATSASARALEILPLPFLVTKAPEEAPPPPAAEAPKKEEAKPVANELPPNPFAPLPQRIEAARAAAAKKKPAPAAVPKREKPVLVSAPQSPELIKVPAPKILPPAEQEPVLPPEAKLGVGALPIRLEPLEREVVREKPKKKSEEKKETPKPKAEAKPKPPPENPLEKWAKAQELQLAGVTLGPVSVAIFATKDGYLTLAVGERFPGTNIELKEVTADHVVLVQGPHRLTLKYGGGG